MDSQPSCVFLYVIVLIPEFSISRSRCPGPSFSNLSANALIVLNFVRSISHSINPLSHSGLKTVTAIELELHLQGDVKKTSKKVTWLSKDQELVPVELVDFDYLITKDKLEEEDKLEDFLNPKTEFRTKAVADLNVAGLKVDDVFQFDRKGYFRIDKAFQHGEPAVAFKIPTGGK